LHIFQTQQQQQQVFSS